MDSTFFHVGKKPQLLVDNLMIECSQGLTRRWHKPERRVNKPVIVRDCPWEQTLYFTYSTYVVLKDPDDGRIKCWYEDLGTLTGKGHPARTSLLYAVSDDGIHFQKPELDVCIINGKPTNIVMGYCTNQEPTDLNPWSRCGVHSNGIVIDPHPTRPEEKFRTIYTRYYINSNSEESEINSVTNNTGCHIGCSSKNSDDLYDEKNVVREVECAYSADGIHWRAYDSKPILGGSSSMLDDVSCLNFDLNAGIFIQNTRHFKMYDVSLSPSTPKIANWFGPYYPHRPDLMNKRRVYQTRSYDFIKWGDLLPVSIPDDEIDNLDEAHYGMQQFRIGDMYFATLGVFRYVDNEMEVRLLYSRDGINFKPLDRGNPFLAPRGSEHWDAHMVSITSPPVEMGDEWLFYHGGTSSHHDYWLTGQDEGIKHTEATSPAEHVNFGLGVAHLRKEGIASLEASEYRRGYFITKALKTEGTRLFVNARCHMGGSIRAEILDLENQPLKGHTLKDCEIFRGDSTRHCFLWNGSSDICSEGWFKVHFQLDHAEIFSLCFE